MKEIKLKKGYFEKAMVNEKTVQFIKGIGVANAMVKLKSFYRFNCLFSYNFSDENEFDFERSILIDENFNEIRTNIGIVNIEYPYIYIINKNIIRVGENDFLVIMESDIGGVCRNFCHIRLENDEFKLVNEEVYYGVVTFTNRLHLIIVKNIYNNQGVKSLLYNVLKGKFVIPELDKIKPLDSYSNIFVCTKVIKLHEVEDYLFFTIDADREEIIPYAVYSTLDNTYLDCKENCIEDLIINRIKELSERKTTFRNKLEEFKNSEEYLEPYQRKLERIK